MISLRAEGLVLVPLRGAFRLGRSWLVAGSEVVLHEKQIFRFAGRHADGGPTGLSLTVVAVRRPATVLALEGLGPAPLPLPDESEFSGRLVGPPPRVLSEEEVWGTAQGAPGVALWCEAGEWWVRQADGRHRLDLNRPRKLLIDRDYAALVRLVRVSRGMISRTVPAAQPRPLRIRHREGLVQIEELDGTLIEQLTGPHATVLNVLIQRTKARGGPIDTAELGRAVWGDKSVASLRQSVYTAIFELRDRFEHKRLGELIRRTEGLTIDLPEGCAFESL